MMPNPRSGELQPGPTTVPVRDGLEPDQIRRASRSVAVNLAEGFRKRQYAKVFVSKLADADGEVQVPSLLHAPPRGGGIQPTIRNFPFFR